MPSPKISNTCDNRFPIFSNQLLQYFNYIVPDMIKHFSSHRILDTGIGRNRRNALFILLLSKLGFLLFQILIITNNWSKFTFITEFYQFLLTFTVYQSTLPHRRRKGSNIFILENMSDFITEMCRVLQKKTELNWFGFALFPLFGWTTLPFWYQWHAKSNCSIIANRFCNSWQIPHIEIWIMIEIKQSWWKWSFGARILHFLN